MSLNIIFRRKNGFNVMFSIRHMLLKRSTILNTLCGLGLLFTQSASAKVTDLVEAYQLAQQHNPVIQEAYHLMEASKQNMPRYRALVLPEIDARANITTYDTSDDTKGRYNTHIFELNLSHAIFRATDWSRWQQARYLYFQTKSEYQETIQQFLFDLVEQYFLVLSAKEDLIFTVSEKKAFEDILVQTKRRVNAGLVPITEMHETQARVDESAALEVLARNIVEIETEKLQELVGSMITDVAMLKKEVKVPGPVPTDINHWVSLAMENNPNLKAAEYNSIVDRHRLEQEKREHWPTVFVNAKANRQKKEPIRDINFSESLAGVTINLPVFRGGALIAQTRQAAQNYLAAKENVEERKRVVKSIARQSFFNSLTEQQRIKLLLRTVNSKNRELNSIRKSHELGVRTIVDVINAQTEKLEAYRDYRKAHYRGVTELTRLKQTAGTLTEADIQSINGLLNT